MSCEVLYFAWGWNFKQFKLKLNITETCIDSQWLWKSSFTLGKSNSATTWETNLLRIINNHKKTQINILKHSSLDIILSGSRCCLPHTWRLLSHLSSGISSFLSYPHSLLQCKKKEMHILLKQLHFLDMC